MAEPIEIPDADRGGDGSPAPHAGAKGEVLEIVVDGKREKFNLGDPEQRAELARRAQFGTNYSRKAEALNAERNRLYADLKPYLEFDKIMQADEELNAIVTARLRGDPLPRQVARERPVRRNGGDDVDEDDDDRDEDALRAAEDRLRRDMSTKDGAIVRALEGLNSRLDKMDERDRERSDSAKIKQHPLFRSWVTDDHITLARERKASHGGSLEDNFKLLFFDEIPKVVEREVTSRIPAEMRRSLISTDNEPVVIDGVRMTEERLQELRDNPDEYAKVRKAIRAAKRRRSGKLPYPGRE